MKKITFWPLFLLLFCSTALSEDKDPLGTHRSFKDESFVVETDENSVSDSLNRISGNIDLGYSSPDQSYQSGGHYRPGPFGRSDLEESQS